MRPYSLRKGSIALAISALLVMGLFAIAQRPTAAATQPPYLPAAAAPATDNHQDPFSYTVLVVKVYYENRTALEVVTQEYDVWAVDRTAGYAVVQVSEAEYHALEAAGYRLEVDHESSQKYSNAALGLPHVGGGIPGYACYRTVEETFTTAETLASAHPDIAEVIDAGDSWEKTQNADNGYDMLVLHITNRAIPGPKPTLFVMSAIHAREYTTAELNTRFAEWLVNGYGVDADATWIVDHHDIHLLLQSNPDGRKKAETGLSWRKNTDNNYCANSNNRGVDLNRNFAFQWGCCGGSSSSQCSATYRGPSPASEPEVQTVQNYIATIFPDQREDPIGAAAPITATGVFMDLHSYSQLVLWPWGFTNQETGNAPAFRTLGRKFALYNNYEPIQAIELYPTDGTTDDYAYGELGVAAYTFELGTQFFQSCSVFENTIYPDNLPALVYAAKAARTPYLTPSGPDALTLALSETTVEAGTPVSLTAQINDNRFSTNNGTEPTQPIASANVYIDTPPWGTTPSPMALQAADGAYDTVTENVVGVIDTTSLAVGRHILFVEGTDQSGSIGAVTAIFLDITAPPTAITLGTLAATPTNSLFVLLAGGLALVGLVGIALRKR